MFLDEAVKESRLEAENRSREKPAGMLEKMIEGAPPVQSFKKAVKGGEGRIRIIAEVKRSSPSAGSIKPDVDVARQIEAYREGGADALSVLTCAFKFGGSLEDLEAASKTGLFPVLRKDFITTSYQVLEARVCGASAVLLIGAALSEKDALALKTEAEDLGMDVLFEAHSLEDIEIAQAVGAQIIGINNRDLKSLEVNLDTTEVLAGYIPDEVVKISESGIRRPEDVERMRRMGIDALLVGGALMESGDPAEAIRRLISGNTHGGGLDVG